jgi:hypothetical protein
VFRFCTVLDFSIHFGIKITLIVIRYIY